MITNLSPEGPLSPLYFLRCSGARLSPEGGLILTFGPWTLASEDASWRVLKGGEILAGQAAADAARLDAALTGCALHAIQPVSKFDLRLMLSGPFIVETFAIRPDTRSVLAIRRDGQLMFDYAVEPAWAVVPTHGQAVGHA